MKTPNNEMVCIEKCRRLVQTYLDLEIHRSAAFWADKVMTLTGNPKDIYRVAQCMFNMKEYQRACHLLKSHNLEKTYILCNSLTVKCLLEANELNEALRVANLLDLETISHGSHLAVNESLFFDDTPKNQIISSVFLLKGKVLESMDNRGLAAECFKQALHLDVYCFEAFDSLIRHQMLSAGEEIDLISSLPVKEQCTTDEAEMLYTLYSSIMKKYQTSLPFFGGQTNVKSPWSTSSLTSPGLLAPASRSTPNFTMREETRQGILSNSSARNTTLQKLKDSLDIQVAEVERLYYNGDYQKCNGLAESILKQDPYHSGCLPIYISCQTEMRQSNKLFTLAHNLVDIYPNLAVSWFAVGCYYLVIDKKDYARRYLAKATSLDKLFGPAWLAYGHSFATENEHDQAMAAYFKACQLMRGCHLPLLYIGLECGLTNNTRLAEKFFKQALTIAPDDPFVLHEMGVIALQNFNYEQAEKHFREALVRVQKIGTSNMAPHWEALLNNLGHTCRKLKRCNEALDYHHQALLLAPQSPSTYAAIAFCYALMNNTEEAVDWFHKALSLKNDDAFCTTMLNYVIEQLTDEKPPYPGAPENRPKFDQEMKISPILEESVTTEEVPQTSSALREPSDMSMSINMDIDATEGTETCGKSQR